MSRWRTGAMLPELMLALVVFATGLALLAEAPVLACAAAAGARDDGEVTLRWTASGDTLRTVVALAAHRALGVADTLVTTVACP